MKISVCGIGAITAAGNNVEQLLNSIREEKRGSAKLTLFDSIIDVPVCEVKLSNLELKKVVGEHKYTTISRTSLLAMAAAKMALEDAAIDMDARIGLISATTVGGMDITEDFYRQFIVNGGKGKISSMKSHDCADSTNRVAKYCGIKGFRTTISTACSSASNAMILGANMLKKGLLDYVVVGGSDSLCRFTLNGFNSLQILDEHECRPFSADRDGLNLGEGAAYIVLTNVEKPNNYYCTLAAYANTNDAHHQTASSQIGEGAYLAMQQALLMSGLHKTDISYINAHGTATKNNDLTEGIAIKRFFEHEVPMFSSTKPYTGHTLAAAGAVEALISILAIKHSIIPPNLGFTEPIEEHGLVPETTLKQDVNVRNVMTNSFGFGGNCTTLIFSR